MYGPQSEEEAKTYRYGKWAWNPTGRAYDPRYCAEEVVSAERGSLPRQCSNKPLPGRLRCAKHDPELRAAKQSERDRKLRAESDAKQARWDRKAAILSACDGLSVEEVQEAIARWKKEGKK